jgi:hypothetical protein
MGRIPLNTGKITIVTSLQRAVRFPVLTVASMKTALWDIAPCSLVEVHGRFIALMMEAITTSKTSVYFNTTTRRYIPESCHPYRIKG